MNKHSKTLLKLMKQFSQVWQWALLFWFHDAEFLL